nr:DUF3748 domain-containing protein [uncultured Draconibacterium sp.]
MALLQKYNWWNRQSTFLLTGVAIGVCACTSRYSNQKPEPLIMKETQLSFSPKNHALDNNDNFSPDDRFLCYDTRGTVFNFDLANCKSIEMIEIATGKETVLWEPESVTGEQAAPGVAAVSWHPLEDKVIFIHGPLLSEVDKRGYYGIRNRTGVEVSADGKGKITKVDMRDVATDRLIIAGAQRGGTHRHEYTRNGKKVGFTYDDFLQQDYDRTIGYMVSSEMAPTGYTHYFALLVKPVKLGSAKPGEIEKAYADSWVDSEGRMRAFVGKVRAEDGTSYQEDLFVVDISDSVDIISANSGDTNTYPEPPKGLQIRRLTHRGGIAGIVRGSDDGKRIAYLAKDSNGILQINVISAFGSDLADDEELQAFQLSSFDSDAAYFRWHPSGDWIFSSVNGNIAATCAKPGENFGKSLMLTDDDKQRSQLVVSRDGKLLAYNIDVPGQAKSGEQKNFMQIFIMELNTDKLTGAINK